MSRLVCFGEMLVRLTAPRGEMLLQTPQLSAHVGGAEANVAICVSRLGGEAAVATVLPDNPLGRAARDELRRHGVDVSNVRFAPGRMGLYFLIPGAVMRAPEVIYDRAGSAFAAAPSDAVDWAAAVGPGDWLHVSGITPAVSEGAGKAALAAVAAAAKAGATVSFDGNYRSKLWEQRGETGAAILGQLLSHASLAFIDERDIALILGLARTEEDPEARRRKAVAAAFEAFPKLQRIAHTAREAHAVSDHALGAALWTRGAGAIFLPPVGLPDIVDRIGGGDAFAGGLLFALMQGQEDTDALTFALHSAAAKHGQLGDASWASEADIRALMAAGGFDVKR